MTVIEHQKQHSPEAYRQETFKDDFHEMEPLLFIVLKQIIEKGKKKKINFF